MTMKKLLTFSFASTSLAMSIPGILPHEYTTNDRLSVEWSTHLTSTGHHKVLAMDDEQPRFVETSTDFYGLPYTLLDNFKLCGLRPSPVKSLMAGYFDTDATFLTSGLEVNMIQAKKIALGET